MRRALLSIVLRRELHESLVEASHVRLVQRLVRVLQMMLSWMVGCVMDVHETGSRVLRPLRLRVESFISQELGIVD